MVECVRRRTYACRTEMKYVMYLLPTLRGKSKSSGLEYDVVVIIGLCYKHLRLFTCIPRVATTILVV